MLDEAAVEEVDDDYWDVDSDEEMAENPIIPDEEALTFRRDFGLLRKIQYEHTNELTIRRYDAFIYEGILASYKAEQVANPLKNPKTARVFAHFIHVTGPVSLSLDFHQYTVLTSSTVTFHLRTKSSKPYIDIRRPNPTITTKSLDIHTSIESPKSSRAATCHASVSEPAYCETATSIGNAVIQTLWLVHALAGAVKVMLTIWLAYALKRLGRSLANLKRRNTIATVATSLLLAFYEGT